MADNILKQITSSKIWNAFVNPPSIEQQQAMASGYVGGYIPGRNAGFYFGGEKNILGSITTRMSVDASSVKVQHVKVDDNERYLNVVKSGLNDCLTVDANVDQTGRAFLRDAVFTLLNEGAIAIVAVDTTQNPNNTEAYDVRSLRVGIIKEWYPQAVRISLYNERTGNREEITLLKKKIAIVENPFYSVMNAPNSTLKRLVSKLNLLDSNDERNGSGKIDMIVQLPYALKSEDRVKKAGERRQELYDQLKDSEYGIAYASATEKIIQLNRPVENNLQPQIEYLTSMLYGQLGLTTSIMDGSADETTMINYYKRTIEPIIDAIAESMTRAFISKTARSQGQKIMSFNDSFKLVPMTVLAEIADKLTRNEVLTSNEIRAILGFKPSSDAGADELRNKNLNAPGDSKPALPPVPETQGKVG